MLMPTRWITTSVRPIARPAKPVGAIGCVTPRMQTRNRKVATTSNTKAEHGVVLAEVARAPAVLAEPAVPPLSLAGQDEIEHDRGDDCAEHLGDPVGDHILHAHAAGDVDAEADRRIDVAAGDRPDAIGHCDDGEAEGAGDAEQVDGCGASPMPPTTAAPHPKNTSANVPMNSATCLFIARPSDERPIIRGPYTDGRHFGKGLGAGDKGDGPSLLRPCARRCFRARPRLYKRRLSDDPLINGAAAASPEPPPPC